MLADSAVEIHGARLMTYDAASKMDRGERATLEAGMAKLHATEMAGRVVDRAMQVFGGIGAMTDMPIEIAYRDLRLQRIGEGTSEIQRLDHRPTTAQVKARAAARRGRRADGDTAHDTRPDERGKR